MLHNVGNVPALNVVVAQRRDGQWINPVFAPPLAREARFPLTWLGRVNDTGLGATYSDFEDHRYTCTLGGERSRTYDGNRLPNWPGGEVRRYWQLERGVAAVIQWRERPSEFTA